MKIASVEITNIKGIERAEFPLGSFTVISGRNASGKSSIQDAIAAVFEGGHDPSLIRLGTEKGVVILTLDNGTRIRKVITPKNSTLDIVTEDGLKVSKPAAFVEKLATGFAYDPIAFLHADEKKRLQFLLEAMPIEFLPDEVSAITGKPMSKALGIEELNQLRQGIYDQRRNVNVEMKELDGSIASMSKALPPSDGEDWPAKVAALSERKTKLTVEIEKVRGNLKAELSDAIAEHDRARGAAISQAQEIYTAAVKAAENAFQSAKDELAALAKQAEDEQLAEINAELQTVAGELATAKQKQREQDRSIEAREQIKRFQDRSFEKQRIVNQLTAQLEKLDELKKRVLSDAAIPGVEIVNGKIMVGGVELDQLNTQAQYFLAFQIASLKQGDLGFMVCDNTEAIVGDEWNEFKAAAAECGFQVLVARAEPDKPLTIEADGEAVLK